MKKNGIKKITKILTSLSVAMMATQSLAMIQDGSSYSAPLKDETLSMTGLNLGQGRATLSLEDAKVFLGLGTGSAQSEAGNQIAGFSLEIPSEVKDLLTKQISEIETDRKSLLAKLESEAATKVSEIRKNRKAIQLSRMSNTQESNETKLSQNLYSSFIQETAIDAKIKHEVAVFDEMNSIELSFVEVAGVRHIQAIQVGMENIWKVSDLNNQLANLR